MKVQILTNLYPLPWEPNRAAFNRQQFQYLSKLCETRITVLVGWLSSLGKKELRATRETKDSDIQFLRYFYLPGFARFTYAISLAASLFFKRRTIARFHADCLLISWAFPDGVAGVLLANSLGLPAVIKVHGSDINMHTNHWLRAVQIRWAMKHAKAVISVSQALAEKLVDLGVPKEKIHTVYNGVDHKIFAPQDQSVVRKELGLARGRQLILYVGNLKAEKGCIELLKAFLSLSDKIPEADLCYIGSGKEKQTLLGLAQAHHGEGRVTLIGSKSHQEIAQWMNASSLVALPSYNEGVPNVLLEAMTCGKPVVATSVGGIPEVVTPDAGILVPPKDTEKLGQALQAALSTNWDAARIVESVAQFSWEKNVTRIHEILTEAAA